MSFNYILALGSNLGDKKANLESAVREIAKLGVAWKISDWFETEPWGNLAQDNFLNGVCLIQSNLEPIDLLLRLQQIEIQLGRTRKIHWGPRTIDIDIIFIEDELGHSYSVDTEILTVPHPYFWERLFVLEPLMQLRPNFVFHNVSIKARIDELKMEL